MDLDFIVVLFIKNICFKAKSKKCRALYPIVSVMSNCFEKIFLVFRGIAIILLILKI